jgi:hypothetical protein
VRFPREWLGPRDELVPFGPAADPLQSGPQDERDAGGFWSEGSASVQRAVAAEPGQRTHIRRAVASARRRARSAVRLRYAPVMVLAASIFAAYAGLTVGASGPTGGAQPARPKGRELQSAQVEHSLWSSLSAALAGRAPGVQSLGASRLQGRVAGRSTIRAARSSARARATSQPTDAPAQDVRTTNAASSVASASSQSNSPAVTSPTTVYASSARTSQSGGQPALGANGALAPGTSPDG